MFTILILIGCIAIGVGAVVWFELRHRRQRQLTEAQQMTRSVARQAQREIAAADYAHFAERRRNGRHL